MMLSFHILRMQRGEVLVTRGALLNDEKVLAQRNNLFHTKCKCNGKFCNVIIDGVSTDNIVYEEMVSKMKLEVRCLNPYQIAWL